MIHLKTLFCNALAATALLASAHAQMPLTLFNGTTLAGWNTRGTWLPAAGVLASNASGPRQIVTAVPFADFNLVFDYNESAPMQAKLRLWAPREGAGGVLVDLDGSGAHSGVGGVEGGPQSRVSSVSEGWHHVQVEASHGSLKIHVDGAEAGSLSGSNTRAGYLGWEANLSGTLQLRNIKLSLTGLTPAFNGSDLGNWKSIARGPESSGGVGHKMEKIGTFGIGGGSTKPHPAKWNVQGGVMHGEDGPGGLEYGTQVDDVILQVIASTRSQPKADHFISLTLRNAAGQLDGGYQVGIGPFSGSIENLAKKPTLGANTNVEETIILAGRTTAIWVNGALSTVYTDSRAEGQKVGQGARTTGGVMTLVLPGDGVQVNVPRLAIFNLPKNYGSTAAVAPPPPVVSAVTPPAAQPAQPSATEKAMLAQQQNTAKQADADRENKQRVAGLMSQAISAPDPQQQMQLYSQVVQLDPSNAPAVQGYKDAQAKVQGAQAAQQQAAQQTVNQQQNQQSKDEQVNASLAKSQNAFLNGRMSEASSSLAVAERLAPDNPLVRELRQRISGASSLHSRLFYLGSAAGALSLLALIAVWIRRKRQQRFPILEITNGLDEGEQYPIDKDLVRIGAVAQDGGQKNDIVVRDVERLISRFHCQIDKKNGLLYLTDLGSSNGTTLEGKTLTPNQPMLLRKGNRINLANVTEMRLGFGRRSKEKV